MLSERVRQFLADRRIAHLATADRNATPHAVPVCFAVRGDSLYVTIDEKPKRKSGSMLKRLRNIAENPAVAVVVDRYHEDWSRLGWVMLHGRAEILFQGTEHDDAQQLLRLRLRNVVGQLVGRKRNVGFLCQGARSGRFEPSALRGNFRTTSELPQVVPAFSGAAAMLLICFAARNMIGCPGTSLTHGPFRTRRGISLRLVL